MPATQQQPKFTDDEAQRLAALVAGLDLSNPNDAEATGKFRALRRMLAEKNIRLVDALELPEIRKAIDDQMQPDRQDGPELQKLREELTARMRDVGNLAGELVSCKELLQRREREYDTLQRRMAGQAPSPAALRGFDGALPLIGACALAVVALTLAINLFAGSFHRGLSGAYELSEAAKNAIICHDHPEKCLVDPTDSKEADRMTCLGPDPNFHVHCGVPSGIPNDAKE